MVVDAAAKAVMPVMNVKEVVLVDGP